jgi:hypothetical protein
MNNRVVRGFLPALLIILQSCSLFNNKEESSDKNVKRTYYPDGTLHKEIVMKDGKQTGSFREYFKNGKLFQEVSFVDNQREGLVKKYYDTGILYEETPYAQGKIHGIKKRYRRTGDLMSEVPYHEGNLCKGLKEYTTDGKVKQRYPKLVITAIDNILKNDTYILELSLSDGTKSNVEYFEGTLTDGKYIGDNAGQVWKVENGVGKMEYKVVSGMFIMEELHFIAKVKTVQGNYYITEANYHLAVENRF